MIRSRGFALHRALSVHALKGLSCLCVQLNEGFRGLSILELGLLCNRLDDHNAPFRKIPNVVLELGARRTTHEKVKAERRRTEPLELFDGALNHSSEHR